MSTKNTVTITIVNGEYSLTIGAGQECDFTKPVEGLETSEITNRTTDLALVDGSSWDGTKLKARPIHIEAGFRSTVNNASNRQRLIKLFNPKNQTTLTIESFGATRQIDCMIEGWNLAKVTNNDNAVKFVVDFIAPNPYMKSITNFGKNMATILPQFAFPWRVLASEQPDLANYPEESRGLMLGGMITGYQLVSAAVSLPNDGDVPCGLQVKIVATGAVTNPKILNGEGEYIRIVTALESGDELLIDTEPRKQRNTLNGVNIFNRIDRTSTLFQMAPGDNHLAYEADSGQVNMNVFLYYTPLYLGV